MAAAPQDPWKIKKAITPSEQASKMLVISFAVAFEFIFPHWMKEMVGFITDGQGKKQHIYIWDVTDGENNPKQLNAYVEMMKDDNYGLFSDELFTQRGLSAGDEIGVYWDTQKNGFKFKLIKKGLV